MRLNAQKTAEPSVSSMCFSQMCKSDVLTHLLVLPFILPMLLLMSITTFLSHKLSPHWKPTLDIELTGSV